MNGKLDSLMDKPRKKVINIIKVINECNPYRHIWSVREKENEKHEGIR